MTLRETQSKFAHMVALLIQKAEELGYEVTLGECLRSKAQAAANAKAKTGIVNSLHILQLAIDINLFKDGVWLTKTTDHEPLGIWWESIGGSWGGRFKTNPDGNHYSLEWQGVR